mmetsp:Transcript_28108/g.80615  ORF Transcript_28108/g.80615 Transcript_28108/m.80615 type:complete len:121 (+) Transcript_28108:184-546(+)
MEQKTEQVFSSPPLRDRHCVQPPHLASCQPQAPAQSFGRLAQKSWSQLPWQLQCVVEDVVVMDPFTSVVVAGIATTDVDSGAELDVELGAATRLVVDVAVVAVLVEAVVAFDVAAVDVVV